MQRRTRQLYDKAMKHFAYWHKTRGLPVEEAKKKTKREIGVSIYISTYEIPRKMS